MAKGQDKLKSLRPKVRRLAEALLAECRRQGIELAVTAALRTVAEQDRLYACGRSLPGKIVTRARGGQSFHNYGLAFDVCPLKSGRADWTDLTAFDRVGRLGMKLGLEWGGSWPRFRDRPHFQYTAGYTIAELSVNKVDWCKFA